MWQKIEQQKLITKIYVMKTSTCRVGDGAVGMGGGGVVEQPFYVVVGTCSRGSKNTITLFLFLGKVLLK